MEITTRSDLINQLSSYLDYLDAQNMSLAAIKLDECILNIEKLDMESKDPEINK
ncbi:MAG: hypothetical protein RLZZ84_1405 [Pseudomonadota bacterium]|jgi:hypothetical protein